MWKPSRTARIKRERAGKARLDAAENANKRAVRRRDGYCRFPLCGCRRLRLRLEVAHQQHKGAGGDSTGERSVPELLVLLCTHRHQHGAVSWHTGRLRWRALDRKAGTGGPLEWCIKLGERWQVVARESAPHVLEPLTDWQRETLERLALMEL